MWVCAASGDAALTGSRASSRGTEVSVVMFRLTIYFQCLNKISSNGLNIYFQCLSLF